jgi:hypothetical protein
VRLNLDPISALFGILTKRWSVIATHGSPNLQVFYLSILVVLSGECRKRRIIDRREPALLVAALTGPCSAVPPRKNVLRAEVKNNFCNSICKYEKVGRGGSPPYYTEFRVVMRRVRLEHHEVDGFG